MADYQVGLETKAKIIRTARHLFYENGYQKTTYADICKLTGISQGTLHYHFNSKATLACAVSDKVADTILEEARLLIGNAPEDDSEQNYLLYMVVRVIYWKLFTRDSRFRRYAMEISDDLQAEWGLSTYAEVHTRNIGLTKTEADPIGSLRVLASMGVERAIYKLPEEDLKLFSDEDILKFLVEVNAKIMDIDALHDMDVLESALHLTDGLDIGRITSIFAY